ncbi:hypothetical protein CEE37_04070 [candidate division LCP-89 bacterium B3_LCP]|uniref:Uncharacterized protein n=1 Tax=candidate division LCP-89 bacterium B3_LCP TaxID=2012998 RepID=A0A532V3H8_UNCL8|nr:MAG: hypothetical protein CEE37_04070 [candidate division LCP-89 bacterium B3_LCP]
MNFEWAAKQQPHAISLDELKVVHGFPTASLFNLQIVSSKSDSIDVLLSFTFSTPDEDIIHAETLPFRLKPGLLYLRNQDFIDFTSTFRFANIDMNTGATDLLRHLNNNGFIPSGTYSINVTLKTRDGSDTLAEKRVELCIFNPFEVDSFGRALTVSNQEDSEAQKIHKAIERILTENRDMLKGLSSYSPNSVIKLSGQTITTDQLITLSERFQEGECQVLTVSVK